MQVCSLLKEFFNAGEMFTFGYAPMPAYVTYRVISKDGFMHDPVTITIPDPMMMHYFAITKNYAILMDLPMIFKPMVRSLLMHQGYRIKVNKIHHVIGLYTIMFRFSGNGEGKEVDSPI